MKPARSVATGLHARSRRSATRAACAVGIATLGVASTSKALEPSAKAPVQDIHRAPQPDNRLDFRASGPSPTLTWAAFQLLPSPEIAIGRQRTIDFAGKVDAGPRTAFGLRWQLTPLLWSFGVHRSQPRWRSFVVDPLARQSGSLELSTAIEYIGGDVDRVLLRPGLRAYFPVLAKGESLSVSVGTSVYSYDGPRVAYDVGAYILSGFVGFQVTVAPAHAPLAAIATFRLRYF